MERVHYLKRLEETIRNNWSEPVLTDIDGSANYTYGDVAQKIEELHALFRVLGVKQGDKIAICGRNCSAWGILFLSITSYKAIAVSILPDFTGLDIHKLVNHSDAKLLFVGPKVKEKITPQSMPALTAVIFMDDLSMIYASDLETDYNYNSSLTNHVSTVTQRTLEFPTDNLDDVALINYTSGTTSTPKGVMLTNRNLSANVDFGVAEIPHKPGDRVISMLPIAHMFGLMFEFLYQICDGAHIYFLTTAPTPTSLMKAFAEVKPFMILTVPLVIEKIMRKSVLPEINKPAVKALWYTPLISRVVRRKVYERLMTAFGGELRHLILGGAALNKEVERCLHQIGFPYTVGYGMTECAPLITYEQWRHFKYHTCGKPVDSLQLRIFKSSKLSLDGEVQVKGDNVMSGYYKNPDATKAAFTEDGWLKTGDLGRVDRHCNLTLRGRCKSMILRPDGQNIYPEEIEDKLNNQPYVTESLVVERGGRLVGLVYSEQSPKEINEIMARNLVALNKLLPPFCHLSAIEVVEKEFEKTPKRSIKRFLYS